MVSPVLEVDGRSAVESADGISFELVFVRDLGSEIEVMAVVSEVNHQLMLPKHDI